MKSIFRLFVAVLLLSGWGLAAASLHVVRTQDRCLVLIPKQKLALFDDTYVDARAWTIQDVADHPALIERVIESGKTSQFAYLVKDQSGDVAAQLDQAVRNAPTTKPDARDVEIRKGMDKVKALVNTARSRAKSATAAGAIFEIR